MTVNVIYWFNKSRVKTLLRILKEEFPTFLDDIDCIPKELKLELWYELDKEDSDWCTFSTLDDVLGYETSHDILIDLIKPSDKIHQALVSTLLKVRIEDEIIKKINNYLEFHWWEL